MIQKTESGYSKSILLAGFSFAFLFLYVLLSRNNRLAADDFYYLKNLNEQGIWNGMITSYNSWVTRWASVLFLNCVFRSYNFFHSLLPFHLLTIFALIAAFMNFIRVAALKFLSFKISTFSLLLYSILFTSSFFFFTFNIGETWFWVTSASMYLWSIIFFIAGSTFIIQPGTTFTKLICACCFLFIGGANEAAALSSLFLLIAGLVIQFYLCNFSFRACWKDDGTQMLFISIASLAAALLISYCGEGRVLRQSALPDTGFLKSLFISVKSFIKLILFYLPLKIHWLVFFSIPWIYLGHRFSSGKKDSLEKTVKRLALLILIFLLLSFISFIPSSFLLGETGPFRTWVLISFYLTVCSMFCGFYLGYKVSWNKKLLSRFFNISLVTLIVLMVINIVEQNEITSVYASSVDQRMNELLQLNEKGEKNTVELNSLPPSGMLYSAEISEDSSNFSNQHLKTFLNLGFEIRKR